MITAQEIRTKSERKYDEVLQATLNGDSCFPLIIRSNKSLSRDFVKMSRELGEVISSSRDRKGFGYSVISETVNTRQHGIQNIPKSIRFETLTDYLKFIGKEKEFQQMLKSYDLIKSEIPQLEKWLNQNPRVIIANTNNWTDLIKVCKWFMQDFKPGAYYIRELPIAVHTKFVEDNKPVLRLLLDELIPDKIDLSEADFEKRFRLRYVQPLIRFRSIDPESWEDCHYNDLAVPLDQFSIRTVGCNRVFVIENKMNFLTFPKVVNAIAIWGKGFGIECLKDVKWLKERDIYYWSDLDAQGFQMLSQLRSYFPQTQSIFMGLDLLAQYKEYIVQGTKCKVETLTNLSNEEAQVFKYLVENNLRLEQERIPQKFIDEQVNDRFGIIGS